MPQAGARRSARAVRIPTLEAAAKQRQPDAQRVPVNTAALKPCNSCGAPRSVDRDCHPDDAFRCQGCGKDDIWTAAQPQWWYEVAKGSVYSTATRCRACRRRGQAGRPAARRLRVEGLARNAKAKGASR